MDMPEENKDEDKDEDKNEEKDNDCWSEIPPVVNRDDDDVSQYEQWQS